MEANKLLMAQPQYMGRRCKEGRVCRCARAGVNVCGGRSRPVLHRRTLELSDGGATIIIVQFVFKLGKYSSTELKCITVKKGRPLRFEFSSDN